MEHWFYLNVWFIKQPRSMCQDFVDFVELSEFCRDEGWSFEPVLVPSLKDKLLLVKVDEIRTLMPTGSLQEPIIKHCNQLVKAPRERKKKSMFTLLFVYKTSFFLNGKFSESSFFPPLLHNVWFSEENQNSCVAYHNGNVVSVVEGEGPVSPQKVLLGPQEHFQVVGVVPHELGDMV